MRTFSLGAAFSVTTGVLLVEFDQVHQLLEYLVGHPLFTHQLPGVAAACAAEVLDQHPSLGDYPPPTLSGAEECAAWVASRAERFGAELEIAPMAPGSHVPTDPIADLADLIGSDRVVVLELPKAA